MKKFFKWKLLSVSASRLEDFRKLLRFAELMSQQ